MAPSGCAVEIITDTESTLEVTERISEQAPGLVVVSSLPAEGLTMARYLTGGSELSSPTCRSWSAMGLTDGAEATAQKLAEVGASEVVFSLTEMRASILKRLGRPEREPTSRCHGRLNAPSCQRNR